jgi:hypothetical protein
MISATRFAAGILQIGQNPLARPIVERAFDVLAFVGWSFHSADPTFSKSVLPGGPESGPLGFDTEARDRFVYSIREDRIVVMDQILHRCVVRERLA